ncbi:hypothetical protein MK338_11620, partial [Streptococcus vestibularis]
VENVR